jgi:hypothetical protein
MHRGVYVCVCLCACGSAVTTLKGLTKQTNQLSCMNFKKERKIFDKAEDISVSLLSF